MYPPANATFKIKKIQIKVIPMLFSQHFSTWQRDIVVLQMLLYTIDLDETCLQELKMWS